MGDGPSIYWFVSSTKVASFGPDLSFGLRLLFAHRWSYWFSLDRHWMWPDYLNSPYPTCQYENFTAASAVCRTHWQKFCPAYALFLSVFGPVYSTMALFTFLFPHLFSCCDFIFLTLKNWIWFHTVSAVAGLLISMGLKKRWTLWWFKAVGKINELPDCTWMTLGPLWSPCNCLLPLRHWFPLSVSLFFVFVLRFANDSWSPPGWGSCVVLFLTPLCLGWLWCSLLPGVGCLLSGYSPCEQFTSTCECVGGVKAEFISPRTVFCTTTFANSGCVVTKEDSLEHKYIYIYIYILYIYI